MIQKMFIGLATIGLLVSLYSDLTVYEQNKVAISTGEWVRQSYKKLQALDFEKVSLLETRLTPAQHAAVEDRLKNLKEVSSAERDRLAEHMASDQQSDADSLEKTLFANAMDILLILIFTGFFFYERRKATNLQSALAKTLAQVDASNQQLQHLLSRRDAKFKTVVHDLKNPLGSIKGFAELLHDDPNDKESVLEMANIIQNVSSNTLTLVSSMLQDRANEVLSEEPLDALECLKETCRFLSPIAQEKNQRIDCRGSDAAFLKARKQPLQDAFFNLVGNALKFSPRGTVVKVEADLQDSFFIVKIKDQGPGFSPEDFPKLFTAEAKLSAKPTGHEISTGFGLYSVKQTLELLDGHIEVSNNPEGGACITLKLPVMAETAVRPNSSHP
jgi:signal transduction histidine kinase